MKITQLTPMLETQDLKKTVDFYTGILEFECVGFLGEQGWARVRKDDVSLMFSLPNEHRNIPGPIMSGSLYFNTENVDEIWEKLREKCQVCYPIENFEYGMREFAVFDNNGYLLQFGQELR